MANVRDEFLELPLEAIEAALDEFDELGSEGFLEKYRPYKRPELWLLRRKGRIYFPRVILAAAYKVEHGRLPAPNEGPRRFTTDQLQAVFSSQGGEIFRPEPMSTIQAEAVREAIQEFDELGRDEFLSRHGYGKAKNYFLARVVDGQETLYDSKAILGVAYGYQYPRSGVPHPGLFSGGQNRTAKILRDLGFTVLKLGSSDPRRETISTVSPGGQGRGLSPKERKAIEKYAERLAQEHYESEGWEVIVRGRPFDLLCTRGDEVLYVEVKGTKSAGSTVILTRNEVDHMRAHFPATALYIVSGVDVREEQGTFIVEGGESRELHPWKIDDADLRVTEYSYRTGIE